tara:strand:+ start:16667 stop:18946 length:2280 start_codon:yes stop_codon:yes gene_type:complete
MPILKSSTQLHIIDYLSEEKVAILRTIDNEHRVLLQADPGAGKTHLFKVLADDITTNKRRGRLVFTAPFLIILKQFKNDLSTKGITVDLELHGTALRKTLLPTDKIITSTYQSLGHIINELTEDDILVVDEAHALFFNYQQILAPRQFYTTTIQNLYHTKSKLVLMSGTPNLSILPILKLHHLKIHKQNNLQAQINIEYCNLNRLEVVKEFAEKALTEHGPNTLNIIYRKSVNDCIKIGQMLIDMGYATEVITSLHKDTDTYNGIIETQSIPKEIQFLVTTNVISTGTNINNTNIGNALMLDEYSPEEIKQFSKRFREKLDIKVEVVNKGFVNGQVTHDATLIPKQRNYLSNTLTQLEAVKTLPNTNFDFGISYDKTDLASPNSFINQTLERYLKQESFYIDDAQNSYDSPNDIANEINKYNDITANVMYDYDSIKKLKFQLGINTSNSKIEADFEAKVSKLITDFEKEIEAYLYAMVNEGVMDYYSKNKINRLVSSELIKKVPYSIDVSDNLKSPLFNKNILIPFLEYREYFKSTKDFIKLLKSKKNKNSYLTSIVFNKIFTNYFDIATTETINEPTSSYLTHYLIPKNISSRQFRSNELKIILRFIELAFNFCYDKDKVIVEKLKLLLESDRRLKKLILETKEFMEYPLTTITIEYNSFSINDYFVKGLIQGIFYTNQVLKKIVISGIPIRALKLKDKLPAGYSNKKIDVSSRIYSKKSTITAKSLAKSRSKQPLVLNEVQKFNIINSYELIIKEQM